MKRVFYRMVMLLCTLSMAAFQAFAAKEEQIVRVGLNYGSSALAEARLDNDDQDGNKGYQIGFFDEAHQFVSEIALDNEFLTISPLEDGICVADTNTGEILYQTEDEVLAIDPNSDLTWFQKNVYRGAFAYRNENGKIAVTNYVELEDYVKGVLPYEMTPSWNQEALKAQAICTRSYVLGSLNKHEAEYGFDVCNTTNCQVYRGDGSATENSNRAVDETAGERLYYDNDPVIGYFFSSDGGATEDAENVWGYEHPYLKGVQDPYEDTENAYVGYWNTTFTAEELTEKLQKSGYSIGEICKVEITRFTDMGNVKELTFTDTDGNTVVLENSRCRTVLGLNSIRYTVSAAADETMQETTVMQPISPIGIISRLLGGFIPQTSLPALAEKQEIVSASASTFTFQGSGWGHHVGMSQHGAKGMAEQGFSYTDILRFYFTDIEIKD